MKKIDHELKLYRIAFVIGAFFYPLFGYIYCDYYLVFDFDGFWERLPYALVSILFLSLTFCERVSLNLIRALLLVVALLVTGHYFYCANISNFHWMYITGLIQLPFICIVMFYRISDAAIYFVSTLIISFVVFENSPFVGITYPMLISTYMLVYWVYFANREGLVKDLENKIDEIGSKQKIIDDKNKSLIKIGELATQVAHDIRSPVTALQAVTEMFTDDMDPKQKRLIENVATRINNIANNLVDAYRDNLTNDLSSIKIGRNISLNSLIEEIVEEKKLALDQKNQIVVSAAESINVPDYLDVTEFQRILSNLINNSLEAIESGGKVAIDLRRSGAHISLTIHDNGKGITPEMQHQLFKKGTTSKPKGAGLGLAHAKEYLDSIASKISIDSIAGKGTTVIIELRS